MTPQRPMRSEDPRAEWEHPTEPGLAGPLTLVTGTCLLWWAVSFLLSPFWLAFRKPEHGILDDICSWGDRQ